MIRLTPNKGKYFLEGDEVAPVLVYGPMIHRWNVEKGSGEKLSETRIRGIIEEVKKDRGIDLTSIADSYLSEGILLNIDEQTVQDGVIPAESHRLEVISFYKSIKK
jgi:hypothetical protein|tara:strand:+ start:21518 stop:21835 length:318 start_codon:yes stop_codon:yes gene_type:complete